MPKLNTHHASNVVATNVQGVDCHTKMLRKNTKPKPELYQYDLIYDTELADDYTDECQSFNKAKR